MTSSMVQASTSSMWNVACASPMRAPMPSDEPISSAKISMRVA